MLILHYNKPPHSSSLEALCDPLTPGLFTWMIPHLNKVTKTFHCSVFKHCNQQPLGKRCRLPRHTSRQTAYNKSWITGRVENFQSNMPRADMRANWTNICFDVGVTGTFYPSYQPIISFIASGRDFTCSLLLLHSQQHSLTDMKWPTLPQLSVVDEEWRAFLLSPLW